MRKLLLFAFLFSMNSLFATGDSLRYLTSNDTVFIKMGNYDEKIFTHFLAQGQTLFSLARFYGLRVEDLYYYNPELKKGGYKIGQAIRIPIPNRAIVRYKTLNFNELDYVPVCYVVRRGDTFFGISRRYFKMPVDTIVQRNHLPGAHSLKPNQVLQIGWMHINGIPDSLRQIKAGPHWTQSYLLRNLYIKNTYLKKERLQSGAAAWQPDAQNETGLYVLHREAPFNSIVSITNPMYNRTVYARVIGTIPNRAHGSEVKVVLSPTIAKMLGAKDAKFFVEVRYLQ